MKFYAGIVGSMFLLCAVVYASGSRVSPFQKIKNNHAEATLVSDAQEAAYVRCDNIRPKDKSNAAIDKRENCYKRVDREFKADKKFE